MGKFFQIEYPPGARPKLWLQCGLFEVRAMSEIEIVASRNRFCKKDKRCSDCPLRLDKTLDSDSNEEAILISPSGTTDSEKVRGYVIKALDPKAIIMVFKEGSGPSLKTMMHEQLRLLRLYPPNRHREDKKDE
jgi:hypothetical protein